MAFYTNGKQEVRLRFSRFAEEVIHNDMLFFDEKRRNTFLNNVIQNFYPTANASIHSRMEEYKDSLITILGNNSSKQTMDLLLQAEEKRLKTLANSYEKPAKGSSNSPIRLQNDLYRYLTDEESGTKENLYNNYTLSGYLKTMIEEYTRLPYRKRERIYFAPKYITIETAIQTEKQLLVTISNGRQFHVLPFSIMEDPLETATYLIGFSYDINSDKSTKKACSFRIATLKNNIRIEQSKNAVLTLADQDLLEDKITQNGVQFILSDNVTVKLKLNEQGIHDFNHQLTLRPTPIDITNNIYTFQCSIVQAKFYFFKFGKNVEILEPQDLREYFKNNYLEAYKIYEF